MGGKKRSYLDQSTNYKAQKPYMRGMQLGGMDKEKVGPDPDDVKAQAARLLAAVIDSPTLDRLHRNWSKGYKDVYGFDYEPEGSFDSFVEDKINKPIKPWGMKNPYVTNEEIANNPEFFKTWEPGVYHEHKPKRKITVVRKPAGTHITKNIKTTEPEKPSNWMKRETILIKKVKE